MDLLDRLLGHDDWTTRQLLLRCRDLTDEQLDREFDIGHRTVRRTLLDVIRNVEGVRPHDRPLGGRGPGDAPRGPIGCRVDRAAGRAADDLARLARAVAQRGGDVLSWEQQAGPLV